MNTVTDKANEQETVQRYGCELITLNEDFYGLFYTTPLPIADSELNKFTANFYQTFAFFNYQYTKAFF